MSGDRPGLVPESPSVASDLTVSVPTFRSNNPLSELGSMSFVTLIEPWRTLVIVHSTFSPAPTVTWSEVPLEAGPSPEHSTVES